MDRGREARGEKDAMTVEIMFALVTGVLAAALVFGLCAGPVLAAGVSGSARRTLLMLGAVLAGAVGVGRVVRVLLRFDRHRRLGR
ncbi:DUF6332 family protein [Streptomyces sp. NPDC049813]|uniref:DUF6332 family protein n=1 Tax=Streptomyces sp. NPDC049813 TaxID=3365597 RepID=UPI003798C6D0